MIKAKVHQGISVLLILAMIMLSWIATPQSVFAASHTVSDGDSLDLTTGVLTKADNSTCSASDGNGKMDIENKLQPQAFARAGA